MHTRVLTSIVISILLLQPLLMVATTGNYAPAANIENRAVLAQQSGTRLTPENHINHVPILIDSDSDWVTQGWTGSGAENDPYVIAGLKIAYDVGLELIRIENTDEHFIIQDCILMNEIATPSVLHLENTSHGAIEFVTISSYYSGISCINASNTILRSIALESSYSWAVTLFDSDGVDITGCNFTSISQNTMWVSNCSAFSSMDNYYQADNLDNGVEILFCDEISISNDYFFDGWFSMNITDCSKVSIIDVYSDNAFYPLLVKGSENINVTSCEFRPFSSNSGGLIQDSRVIRITDSYFSADYGYGLGIFDSNDTLIAGNHINVTGYEGLRVNGCKNVHIEDNLATNIDDEGFRIINSDHVTVESNFIMGCGKQGIYSSSVDWFEVSNNEISLTTLQGGYIQFSYNGYVHHNIIESTPEYGIEIQNSENWTLSDNELWNISTGISASSVTNMSIYRNTIGEASGNGISVVGSPDSEIVNNTISDIVFNGISINSHRMLVVGNSIDTTYKGIVIESYDNCTMTRNSVANARFMAYSLSDTANLIFQNNTLVDSRYIGVYVNDIAHGTFSHNHLVRGGFMFETNTAYEGFNNTFSDNFVNEKPLYHGYETNGLVLNGDDYGEIILINCNNSIIENGTFINLDGGFHIWYSDHVEISDVTGVDNSVANLINYCSNISIHDVSISGENYWKVLPIYYSDDTTIENVNITGDQESFYSINILYSDYVTISDCTLANNNVPLRVESSNNYSILDCGFSNSKDSAILIYNSEDGVIQNCHIDNATYGINMGSVDYLRISENTILHTKYGVYTTGASTHVNVSLSAIQDSVCGIRALNGNNWIIANNTIMWNSDTGIYLSTVTAMVIEYNIIALNGMNGYDNVFRYWDDNVDTGNWWDDYSPPGVYNVGGSAGSQDRYPMQFTVTEPIINQPMDIYYAEGTEGHSITWIPFDDALRDWKVDIDGTIWSTGSWNYQNIAVNVDGLPYGTHTVVVTVWDTDQNLVTDTALIHVYDDTPPEIDGPPNLWLFVGTTEQTIDWEVFDLNPDTYTLLVDDVEFDTGSWTSGTLTLDVDDIAEGEHTLVLTIYDIDGNSVSDTILVLVIDDDTNPVVEDAEDVLYVEGATGNTLHWSAEDDYPASFEVTFNGSVVEEGAWGGSGIIFNVDGLTPGIYEYMLTVYDHSGNSATSSANVTVLPVVPAEPSQPIDWVLLVIIGAIAGGAVVVVVIIYYLRKKQTS